MIGTTLSERSILQASLFGIIDLFEISTVYQTQRELVSFLVPSSQHYPRRIPPMTLPSTR